MNKALKDIRGKSPDELLEIYRVPTEPSINIDRLAGEIGISIIPIDIRTIEDDIGISQGVVQGAVISDGNQLNIFYQKGDTENRRRYTIAREIAYCCLRDGDLPVKHVDLLGSGKHGTIREKGIDIFAGALLIPKESLIKVYNKFYFPSLAALAEIFKVSTKVMAARLEVLNLSYFRDAEISEV